MFFNRDEYRPGRVIAAIAVFYLAIHLANPIVGDPLRATYYIWKLDTEETQEARKTLQALHEMGPVGEKAVLEALEDEDPLRRKWATEYIYRYNPENAESHLLTALADDDSRVWVEARSFLWGKWSSSDNEEATRYFLDGIDLSRQKRYREALKYFETALDKDPEFAECRYQMGKMAESMGDPQTAIEHYRKTLQINSSHFEAMRALAELYREKGQIQLATSYIKRFREVFPYYKILPWERAT